MRLRWSVGWLWLTLWLCCGCASAPLAMPGEGGRNWQRLTSDHFELSTNVDDQRAREVLDDLERAYWVMANVALPLGDGQLAERTRVALFADLDDIEALGYLGAGGVFVRRGDEGALLVLPERAMDRPKARQILLHELCHRFVHARLPSVPPWLDEGLAEYYSTAEIGDDWVRFGAYLPDKSFGNKWTVGWSDGNPYVLIPQSDVVPLAQLRQLDYATFLGEVDETHADPAVRHRVVSYASAWAAVHALHLVPDGHPRFQRYLRLMGRGISEEEAFAVAFGDVSVAALDAALSQVVSRHATDIVTFHFKERPAPAPPAATPLNAGQAQLVLANARNLDAKDPERAGRDLDKAVRLAPRDAEVLRARGLARLGRQQPDAALADLRQAHSLAPDSARHAEPLAALLLAQVEQGQPSAALLSELEGLSHVLLARANSAKEWCTLGLLLLQTRHNLGAGRQFAERGLRLDSACSPCYETLALAAAGRGDFKAAVVAQNRALSFMPDGVSHRRAFDRLIEYRRRSMQAQPEPPAP